MQGYAGHVDSLEAWNALSATRRSVLVDVRTRAKLEYVRLPDLDGLEKQVVCVEWQIYPSMYINEVFTDAVLTIIEQADAGRQPELFFVSVRKSEDQRLPGRSARGVSVRRATSPCPVPSSPDPKLLLRVQSIKLLVVYDRLLALQHRIGE